MKSSEEIVSTGYSACRSKNSCIFVWYLKKCQTPTDSGHWHNAHLSFAHLPALPVTVSSTVWMPACRCGRGRGTDPWPTSTVASSTRWRCPWAASPRPCVSPEAKCGWVGHRPSSSEQCTMGGSELQQDSVVQVREGRRLKAEGYRGRYWGFYPWYLIWPAVTVFLLKISWWWNFDLDWHFFFFFGSACDAERRHGHLCRGQVQGRAAKELEILALSPAHGQTESPGYWY